MSTEQTKPVLKKKFDTKGFQWMQDGKVMKIETLCREDLMQIACECMTALDRMEEHQLNMAELTRQWQRGEIEPDAQE
jgi:hypothetical protein